MSENTDTKNEATQLYQVLQVNTDMHECRNHNIIFPQQRRIKSHMPKTAARTNQLKAALQLINFLFHEDRLQGPHAHK